MSVWAIVGGTGTFGREAVKQLLTDGRVRKIRVISRDEAKQAEMRASIAPRDSERVVFILGDVRDRRRMLQATRDVDFLLHAAALKRIESVQWDVREAIQTNVMGTLNVCEAAVENGAEACVLISSDKAASPHNAYGASKLLAEHAASNTRFAFGDTYTRLCSVRYGNVVGSRGSVIESWRKAKDEDREVELRDPMATRFWLTIHDAVKLALWVAAEAPHGSLTIPSLSAASLGDVARAVGVKYRMTALLDAEKPHEELITAHELARAEWLDRGGLPFGVWQVPAVTGTQPWPKRCRSLDGFSKPGFKSDCAPHVGMEMFK